MISFLVKLANLLDARGQYKMAREVDDLVEKLAQINSPEKLQSLPEDEKLQSLPEDALQSVPQQSVPMKMAPKKVPRKNPLIVQIQTNIGITPTGYWDKPTNNKFIELMNSEPEYAKMMEGGKFKGTLQKAVQLTSQLATLRGMPQEEVSKASPAAYKSSKYDLLDIQDEINRLVNAGKFSKEDIENLIGSATIQADKAPGDAKDHQEAFEKIFKQLGRRSVR